jgi:lipopolysaccharide transport system ATP-binding protein
VAFAEVEKFLDTQVKHYSSGMFVRLGFSIAAHLETEILFVDEVLSVGDLAFQEKCLGKMQNVASSGRTVIFVSHNLMAIEALCQHVIWLERGAVMAEGRPGAIASRYLESVRSFRMETLHEEPQSAPGNEIIRLRRASVRPATHSDAQITTHTSILMEFELWVLAAGARLSFEVQLYNAYGIRVLFTGLFDARSYPEGLVRISARIPGDLLNTGIYRIEFFVLDSAEFPLWTSAELLTFEVADSLDLRNGYLGEWPGAVRANVQWTTEIPE